MIRTVLFDLDGTILDTNELIFLSLEYAWERMRWKPPARERLIPRMGDSLLDIIRTEGEAADEGSIEAAARHYQEHYAVHHDAFVRSFPNVNETIAELRGRGVALGLVTTKRRKPTELGLRLCGLDDAFGVIVTGSDVTRFKPDPEPVRKAVEALGAAPGETLMVGDSAADIMSAAAAGVRSAAVAWSLKPKEMLMALGPDYWVEDIRELLALTAQDG